MCVFANCATSLSYRTFLLEYWVVMNHVWRRLYSVSSSMLSGEIKKPWRDAASLIIAAPSELTPGKFSTDYQILFLKRGAKSSFYPNAYVYPGGIIDDADKSSGWIDIFRKMDPTFCENVNKEFLVQQTDGRRPFLFPGDENALKNGILPNEIAFRICAIRESFEESGLLLLTDEVQNQRRLTNVVNTKSLTSLLSNDAAEDWRKKVHSNAKEFMNLCIQLEKVPDIWSLKEWFHWLTPIIPGGRVKIPRRYDTVFYSCCLQEAPSYFRHDKVETTESIWISPGEMMEMYLAKQAFLAPPQILETLKLLNFSTLEDLATYINQRALKGLINSLPYFFLTKDDKLLEVWPGDDRYPEDPDWMGERKALTVLSKTMQEVVESEGNNFNCHLCPEDPATTLNALSCNIILPYGLVSPVVLRTSNGHLAKL